jgi:hypothetical protein
MISLPPQCAFAHIVWPAPQARCILRIKNPCTSKLRPLLVKIGGLLKIVGGAEEDRLLEMAGQKLQTDGQALSGEATGNRDARDAGEIGDRV